MIESKGYFVLNCNGVPLSLEFPIVMGILNLTPDSFSDGGNFNTPEKAIRRVEEMINEGAKIIDIGGYSSRPDAPHISEAEEIKRIYDPIKIIRREFPETILSIDTFRATVAEEMLGLGAHIINDISGGLMDRDMIKTVALSAAPYIMMHIQGTPQTMQQSPRYDEVATDILKHFTVRIKEAKIAGIKDIIIDPGFGFGKTLTQNYQLLGRLSLFRELGIPLMIGLSRKSMIYKPLNINPQQTLPYTTALHWEALRQGANILRTHDIKTALDTVALYKIFSESNPKHC